MKKITFIGIAAIIIFIVIACTPKKTESDASAQTYENNPMEKSFDYSKILNGDLSEFAGIWWANGWGERKQLWVDDGTLSDGYRIGNFNKYEDGSYYWTEGYYDARTQDGWSTGIYMFPPGIKIENPSDKTITPSDITKIRMGTGYEPPEDEKSIFYIETIETDEDSVVYYLETNKNIQVSVKATTNEIFWELDSYIEYTDDNGSEWLIFTTNTNLEDFWFMEIGHFDDPFSLYVPRILFKCQLLTDLPFLVMLTALSGIPQRGISYIDENNIRRYFYIAEDGMDGGYHLFEFHPNSFG